MSLLFFSILIYLNNCLQDILELTPIIDLISLQVTFADPFTTKILFQIL
jgi:hypothetical protein